MRENQDKLVSYNGLTIDYDALGNPLKYNASIFGDSDTNMNLEWNGRLLTAATKDDNTMRFEYSYDAGGLRTEKIIYTGETISEESVDENGDTVTTERHIFIPLLKFEYIWSGNVPAGYRILIYESVKDENGNDVLDDNGNAVMQISDSQSVVMNIIYNENGESLGVNCHAKMDGKETSTTFLFIKDAQGNIASISALEGGYFFNFFYDAFGMMTVDVTGTEIDKIQECIDNAETNIEKVIYAIGGGLGAAIVTAITLACVPNAYKGYILDYETGLYYCQSRYYSPTWGRFINADDTAILEMAKGEVHGSNLFAYCNNNPVMYTDTYGYFPTSWIIYTVDLLIIAIPVIFSVNRILKNGKLVASAISKISDPLAKIIAKALMKIFTSKKAALIALDVVGGMVKAVKYFSKISIGFLVEYVVDCLDGRRNHDLNTKAKLRFQLVF